MNKLNKFLVAIAATLILATGALKAQQYQTFSGATTLLTGGTNNVAATATNTVHGAYRIDIPRSEYVVLEVSYTPILSNAVITLSRGADVGLFETNRFIVWTVTGANTMTNILAGGVPYYTINTIENTNSAALTNISFKYSFKR